VRQFHSHRCPPRSRRAARRRAAARPRSSPLRRERGRLHRETLDGADEEHRGRLSSERCGSWPAAWPRRAASRAACCSRARSSSPGRGNPSLPGAAIHGNRIARPRMAGNEAHVREEDALERRAALLPRSKRLVHHPPAFLDPVEPAPHGRLSGKWRKSAPMGEADAIGDRCVVMPLDCIPRREFTTAATTSRRRSGEVRRCPGRGRRRDGADHRSSEVSNLLLAYVNRRNAANRPRAGRCPTALPRRARPSVAEDVEIEAVGLEEVARLVPGVSSRRTAR